ncbi:helix-turn-helix domain-containing protein [Streptomyces sp. NPDC088197]|uniref:helix-turn-helix domain-containing protein n=1 Tax=Streptomyces sp. NPDC088197 TaxID=3365840 RepID=UPI00381B86F3
MDHTDGTAGADGTDGTDGAGGADGTDDEVGRTLDAVGPRLKNLRLGRDLTLTHLAAATGVSVSTLSRLEAGLRRPTLEQLLPLARVYGVTIDELVDAPRTGNPRLNLRPIACKDGSTVLPLTRRPGGIQAYKFVLPAPPRGPVELVLRTHEGYDWIYVLNGTLRLVLGEHDLVLKPGEAAEFDTRTPHWFGSTGSGPVEFLSLVGKQGERAHVRAAPDPAASERS